MGGHPPSISAKLLKTMRGQWRGPRSPLGRAGYRGNTTPAQIVTPPAIDVARFSSAYVVVKYDAQVIGLRAGKATTQCGKIFCSGGRARLRIMECAK